MQKPQSKTVSTQETKLRGGKPSDLLCSFSANSAQLTLRVTQTICMERQSDTVWKQVFGNLECFFKEGNTYDTLETRCLKILLSAFFGVGKKQTDVRWLSKSDFCRQCGLRTKCCHSEITTLYKNKSPPLRMADLHQFRLKGRTWIMAHSTSPHFPVYHSSEPEEAAVVSRKWVVGYIPASILLSLHSYPVSADWQLSQGFMETAPIPEERESPLTFP